MSSSSTATCNLNYSELMMQPDQHSSNDDDMSSLVMEQSPKPCTFCLFLGDISLFCSENDLIQAFEKFGQLADVRIKRNKVTKRNLSFGFVEYYDFQSADAAVRAMNGQVVCGRALKVSWSESKDTTEDDKKFSSEPDTKLVSSKVISIYVAFNSTVPNVMINDETLRLVFAPYGQLEDVSIKQSSIYRQTECQRGYAFVCFAPNEQGMQAALHAAAHLADCHIEGVHYRCELSNNLRNKISPVSFASISESVTPVIGNNSANTTIVSVSSSNAASAVLPISHMPMHPPPQQAFSSTSQQFSQAYIQPAMPTMMFSSPSSTFPGLTNNTTGAPNVQKMIMQPLAPPNVPIMLPQHMNQPQLVHFQQPMYPQPPSQQQYFYQPVTNNQHTAPSISPVPQPVSVVPFPSTQYPQPYHPMRHVHHNMMMPSPNHGSSAMPMVLNQHILSNSQFVQSPTNIFHPSHQQQHFQQQHSQYDQRIAH